MPREREAYRDIYANLIEHFGGKRILKRSEIARYLQVTPRWTETNLGITANGISIEKLARRLEELS